MGLDNVEFSFLNQNNNDIFTKCFSKEEISEVIWDCENSKSLELTGLTLTFSSLYVRL